MTYLYSENYKTLMKEIEDDRNKWKTILFSWIGRINIVKMSILPKTNYRLSAMPIKITMTFLLNRSKENTPKIYTELQKTLNSQSKLKLKAKLKLNSKNKQITEFKKWHRTIFWMLFFGLFSKEGTQKANR